MEQWERLGNPQGRLEMDSTWSPYFIAGLITGEGSFCLGVQRVRGNKLRITPIFALFMSDRETVMTVAGELQLLGLPVYIQERPKAGRDQVGIHIHGMKRVMRYCQYFSQYLTGQKKQACDLVYDFIESRERHPVKGSPYTEQEKDIVRRLREVNGNTNGRKNPL
jgi:hypothetical protein